MKVEEMGCLSEGNEGLGQGEGESMWKCWKRGAALICHFLIDRWHAGLLPLNSPVVTIPVRRRDPA